MPLLHFHSQGHPSRGAVLWFSLRGKATEKDWPEISKLLSEGYEVFSIDFRGLGETRMNYRAKSPDDPELVQGDFDEAYVSPLSSVLAGYVYNSLLLGRPYFLQMMDDLKIAELFIRNRNTQPRLLRQPLTISASGDAYILESQFKRIDRGVTILPTTSKSSMDWSAMVTRGQEQWPIAFLMPSGALIR
jgi:hypothetical protein